MMKRCISLLLLLVAMRAAGQSSLGYLNTSDDGSLLSWIGPDISSGKVFVCRAESLSVQSVRGNPVLLRTSNARLCGNGKYLFWYSGKNLKRAKYSAAGLSDTVDIYFPGISQFAYAMSDDGTKLLACYDAPTLPKRCSPGYRRLFYLEERNGKFEIRDTLSSADTCHFVDQSHLLPNGYVFWTSFRESHLLQPLGNGKFKEVFFPGNALPMTGAYSVPQNGNSIFISGFYRDSLTHDSAFSLFECRFVNGKYAAPVLIHQWKDAPKWGRYVAVSPDGMHLGWTTIETDPKKNLPDVLDWWTMHWENGKWSEPELIFNEFQTASSLLSNPYFLMSNNSIVWSNNYDYIGYCKGLHKGAIVENIQLFYERRRTADNIFYAGSLRLSDTLIEKEDRLVDLTYVNNRTDSLRVTIYQGYPQQPVTTVPTTSHSWVTIFPNFPELQEGGNLRPEWLLAPGDTLKYQAQVSFTAAGQLAFIQFFAQGKNENGFIEFNVAAGTVLKDTRRSPFDPYCDARGKARSQVVRERNGFTLKMWYPNGQLHYSCSYDEKNHETGKWEYYAQSGVLLAERKYSGVNSYTSKTWYANGQLCTSGEVREGRHVGTWYGYYADGKKRSEAKFRKVWFIDIYKGQGTELTPASYAAHYREWYENGQLKFDVSTDSRYRPNGTWKAWYADGTLQATCDAGEKNSTVTKVYSHEGDLCYNSAHDHVLPVNCADPFRSLPPLHYEKQGHFGYGRRF